MRCGDSPRAVASRAPAAAASTAIAERADVLVYDVWASGDIDSARTLIENIREIHPDTPLVLTSPGLELSWEEGTGRHAVTSVLGQPTGTRLHEAIQVALSGAAAVEA